MMRRAQALLSRAKTNAVLLMVVSMVLWQVVEILAAGMMRGTPIPQLVWLRYFFHLLFMAVCFVPFHGVRFVRTSRPWLHLGRSLLMLAMPMCFWLGGIEARMADVLGAFWSVPLWVVVLAPLAGERLRMGAVSLAIMGWVGALAIYRPNMFGIEGLLFGMGMASSFGLYIVLTAVLDRTESVLTNLFWSSVAVFVVLSLFLPQFWHPVGLMAWFGAVIVAVLGWFTLATLDLALRLQPPSRLAGLLLMQPLGHVLLQAIVRGRLPGPIDILGTALMVLALVLGLRLSHRTPASHS